MNMYEKAIQGGAPVCDICGTEMIVLWGGGFDNDRIYCPDYKGCGAEIVYPTSSENNATAHRESGGADGCREVTHD